MKAKELFNQIAINQTVGIGFDYNEAVGKLSINTLIESVLKTGVYHMCLRVLRNPSLENL